jgi:quercetin dioxygenase-like cupin family protein
MEKGKIFRPEHEIKKLEWYKSIKGSPGVWIKDMLTVEDNEQVTVRFVKVEPGGEIIPHTHEVMEVFYILDGEGELLMSDTKQICSQGTCIVAPAGEKHGLKNILDQPIMLLCVFTPPLQK